MSIGAIPLQRGDIIIAAFPFTNLSGSKRRPAVVLAASATGVDSTLAFISSVIPATFQPSDIAVVPSDPDFSQIGLKVPSVIRLNKLATIERSLISRRIGRLTAARLQLLDEKLALALGIDLKRFHIQERQRLAILLAGQGMEALLQELQRS